ncbi:hypothetical protein I4I73_03455 [Pseudonocardia sp. KRD-184]|uniref:HTH luxR-type domain-containing protein n=1 Tax=Pseudonocardia oceani TaxID=2792013 RepID=A0ABS6UK48_9PSEU|nr:LuxR C-terminal-related transcriptional regulator [Pseudonocardia oceani]MBW0088272.1 hypothetical protein [Pseudonocardia oceani]MBW0095054.1 hypothetical protein [Pseudonocardia oceani]MBW0121093.1 hypothetical protein [Pseudonocardia oceani]MBW0131221.1 hypothetical protein [Pseudonocardia oceani]MBW0132612.1 hypothetical protein [Pseudonocardia oceani]
MIRHATGSRHPARARCTCQPAPADDRELLIVARIAAGIPLGQVATELHHTESSISTYVKRARERVGARDKAHLVAIAFRDRLIGFDRDGRVVVAGRAG